MAAWFSSSGVKGLITEDYRVSQKFLRQSFLSTPGHVCRFRRVKPHGFRTDRPEISVNGYLPMRQFQALIQPLLQKTNDPLPLQPLIG
jgi:hypothetical protein